MRLTTTESNSDPRPPNQIVLSYHQHMSIGINVEHSVAHVHTQNGLAESLIKRLQLIARPLLMKTKLPAST